MYRPHILLFCLFCRLSVGLQSNLTTTNSELEPSTVSTIDVLPKVTPFQIPPGVLSGLGLPLDIPSEQAPAWKAPAGRPGRGFAGVGLLGGLAGAPPSFQDSGGRRGYNPPEYGQFGMQGGLPYELYKPRIEGNITSITGAGHYTIYQCYNSHLAHRSASKTWQESSINGKITASPTVIVPTQVIITTFYNKEAPTISRCDNVVVIPSPSVTPISLTFDESWTSTIQGFPTPSPACVFKEHQCDQAWSAYSAKTYSIISSIYSSHFAKRSRGLPGSIVFNQLEPPCEQPLQACPPAEEIASCQLHADAATVYYWPTAVSGNFCGAKITAEASPSIQGKPNTAVYGKLTITSPSPLVVIPSVIRSVLPPATMVAEESDIVYKPCGYAKELKLQLDPANFSSIRTVMSPTKTVRHNYTFSTIYSSTTKAYSFEFADLGEAWVPWEAFIGVGDCALREQGLCGSKNKTIMPSEYKPELVLGSNGVNIAEPTWLGCSLPNLRSNVQFVPITAATVTAPSITHWGATVSVGARTTRLEASPSKGVQTPVSEEG